jgi:hypothetical protein
MSRQPKYADFAARHLVWDGYFGLVTVEEFATCDGYRPRKVRNREDAIALANELATESEARELREIYGSFPI